LSQQHLFILLLALVLDALIGDPDWLWRRLPHPIVIFGWLIDRCEKIGNRLDCSPAVRRVNGFVSIFLLLALAIFIGLMIAQLCHFLGEIGIVLEAALASLFLAQKSLNLHVRSVYLALKNEGIDQARKEVAKIVGRDPLKLDEVGICRAAIESLSENSSDGVIAPAFWFLIMGLPGLLAYKMLNTADSMIGHKNNRYAAFGFAAARLDDLANLIPARLTSLLVIIAALIKFGSTSAKTALLITLKDAKKHRSPNAGWPESAYAGAIGISLAGPRFYGDRHIDADFQNENARPPRAADIARALCLFWYVQAVFFTSITLFLLFFSERT